ncbi:unnamed protein product [Arabis nemorensis]|uniref:Uncharacterized protein n=1 Tax=Arabis nemorensis TaxID=586526 RepID=A0A565AVF6_9BRAS|nr:unnamed protein product [Arabis nemorensis]
MTLRSGTQLDEVLMPKETGNDVVIEVLKEDKAPSTEVDHETQEEVEIPPEVTRVYKPKIPFPSALKKPKKEKEQAKLKEPVS